MIISVTFSKPAKNISEILGKDFVRAKIKLTSSSGAAESQEYFAEFFTEKQAFHRHFSASELDDFIKTHAGTTFKNVVERTESEEITLMASKKGKITRLVKKLKNGADAQGIGVAADRTKEENSFLQNNAATDGGMGQKNARIFDSRFDKDVDEPRIARPEGLRPKETKNIKFADNFSQNRRKNYILAEGRPVPFLVRLGIMTAEGKVVSAKYDKFRQINRFLEFVDDILPDVLAAKRAQNDGSPLSIVDFGSGKSYLTFAVQYFLSEIKEIPCEIFGLDLKKDVIEYCSRLASELGLKNLSFAVGDIADFNGDKNPDIVITLHACDTATDYALDYAVSHGAKAILSVPCCQHEINSQLTAKNAKGTGFEILSKYGLIKEKFSALLTDALRGDLLEQRGYKVQMLEFIDDSATPKNLLIRAVKTMKNGGSSAKQAEENQKAGLAQEVLKKLEVKQTLEQLFR